MKIKSSAIKILVVSLMIVPIMSFSTNILVDKTEAMSIAIRFVNDNALPSSSFLTVDSQLETLVENDSPFAHLITLHPQGYVAISAFNNVVPIVSFSFDENFPEKGTEERAIAVSLINGIAKSDRNKNPETGTRTIAEKMEVGPFVQSLWGQVNCHDNNGNLVNVSNYYTPNNYAPGCVAISMATLLHHYEWPINGTGSHTYSDVWGSSKGTYTANFEETFYSWVNMLDRYKGKSSTDWQREAEGLLVYQTAVALEMDFEYNGSTSNVNRIPAAGKNYFRFSSMKRQFGTPVFWQLLDSNMMHEIPVILAIKADNGAGHSIVCDGLRIEEDGTFYYHLNNGWWGNANGWYRLREGSLGGGYDDITDGVFYFLPIPALSTPIVSESAEIVTLNWQYAKTEHTVDAYELQQKIDNDGWETITDDIQDTTFDVDVNLSQTYTFRVRAKVEGRWSTESWSTEEQMGYLAVDEITELDAISFGPNPVDDRLYLQFPGAVSSPVKMSIVTMEGKSVYASDNGKFTTEIVDTHTWNPGVYLMILENKTNRRVVKLLKK